MPTDWHHIITDWGRFTQEDQLDARDTRPIKVRSHWPKRPSREAEEPVQIPQGNVAFDYRTFSLMNNADWDMGHWQCCPATWRYRCNGWVCWPTFKRFLDAYIYIPKGLHVHENFLPQHSYFAVMKMRKTMIPMTLTRASWIGDQIDRNNSSLDHDGSFSLRKALAKDMHWTLQQTLGVIHQCRTRHPFTCSRAHPCPWRRGHSYLLAYSATVTWLT